MTLLWLSCRCRDLRDADRRTESLRLPYRLSAYQASRGPEPRRPRVVIPFKQASSRASWPKRGTVCIVHIDIRLSCRGTHSRVQGSDTASLHDVLLAPLWDARGQARVRYVRLGSSGHLAAANGRVWALHRTLIPGRRYRGCEWGTVAYHGKGR